MLKALYAPQQPMHGTHLLQAVKVGALATKKRCGLRNARSKTAARALNAPVRMLALLQATVVHGIFSPSPFSPSCKCYQPFFFIGATKPRPIQGIIEHYH